MARRITRALIIAILLQFAFASVAFSSGVKIDVSPESPACVLVGHPGAEYGKVKAIVEKDGKTYIYDIRLSDEPEVLPLQLGNGAYTVRLMRRTSGTKYKEITRKEITVNIPDENQVFLASVQNVAWKDSEAVAALAAELTASAKTDAERIRSIFDYVVNNIAYDYEKARTVQAGYVPDLDQVLVSKKGICYDYASLFAGMARSLGIPAKLVTGYVGTQRSYHAWNEVLVGEEWQMLDPTRDAATVDKLPGSASPMSYEVRSVF